ncbi:hypothetical protein [Mesorhizobium sp. WSM2239]|uniref:CopG family transcriptional regulator n=2 Tax=unclassified Mesorhizobium TaxID=325217 RepID=A0AAU8D3T5_9HYPH
MNQHQEAEDFFRARAARADRNAFLDFLDGGGNEPPPEGDVLPAKPAHVKSISGVRGGKTG